MRFDVEEAEKLLESHLQDNIAITGIAWRSPLERTLKAALTEVRLLRNYLIYERAKRNYEIGGIHKKSSYGYYITYDNEFAAGQLCEEGKL